jgi:hypothetical protein
VRARYSAWKYASEIALSVHVETRAQKSLREPPKDGHRRSMGDSSDSNTIHKTGGVAIQNAANLKDLSRLEREIEVGIQAQQRARLLARMAGNIAGGIEANAACYDIDEERTADRAVRIAESIAKRLGL